MASRRKVRNAEPDVAEVAAVIGDPGRAAMLMALLDGRDLAASELALRAQMTPQAATAHLKRLTAAGLIVGRADGRHRFFRLAHADVGEALEALAAIAKPARIVGLDQSVTLERMRTARSCYDHAAGRLGVALTDYFVDRGAIAQRGSQFVLGTRGAASFALHGIDVECAREQRRAFARACIDWTERRPHLAGSLGASLLELLLRNRWVLRHRSDRSLRIMPEGARELHRRFGIALAC